MAGALVHGGVWLSIHPKGTRRKKILYRYFGGNPPATPDAGKAAMEAWMAYFAKMGDKIVDGGAPLGPHMSVGGKPSTNPSGFSIVSAASLEQAVALTEGHPHLMVSGTIEVCETQPIPT